MLRYPIKKKGCTMLHQFKKGDIIVRQGESDRKTLFILIKGKCSVKRAVNNKLLDCGLIREGDIFGEISMILV